MAAGINVIETCRAFSAPLEQVVDGIRQPWLFVGAACDQVAIEGLPARGAVPDPLGRVVAFQAQHKLGACAVPVQMHLVLAMHVAAQLGVGPSNCVPSMPEPHQVVYNRVSEDRDARCQCRLRAGNEHDLGAGGALCLDDLDEAAFILLRAQRDCKVPSAHVNRVPWPGLFIPLDAVLERCPVLRHFEAANLTRPQK